MKRFKKRILILFIIWTVLSGIVDFIILKKELTWGNALSTLIVGLCVSVLITVSLAWIFPNSGQQKKKDQ
ncbi:hypothetical protein COR50_10510 [Chitinophaga caeni]|uniref:Uncharacterized protein n=1 Tax=Chitinophaga caeni TaxID=2029983 RepID=A0A291QUP4_9BACT|nr:hypothetical protein [Chitinophaga caeni]ATL47564.1 hypothetical protein COR50_10510 [Chitinophaga caeni]